MIRFVKCLAALISAIALSGPTFAAAPPAHEISVRIEPATHSLQGRDTITFDTARAATLLLSTRFKLDSLLIDGSSIQAATTTAGQLQHVSLPAARRIDVRWHGTLAALDSKLDHRATLTYNEPVTGAQGTFLPAGSGWYPSVDGALERYTVELDLPASQRGLVPGRLTEERVIDARYRARFDFREPAEGISLMAGPYRVDERRLRTAAGTDVRLRTYFHAEIADLAGGYLDSVAAYLDMYERWIGAYPFSELSIVSSPTPTGFGMPTLTYLGISVLRLPFIRSTSLGHEVLHNWWGNGVYPDYAHGNWSEGLTTFMADYAYRERETAEAAKAMRLAWLRDYAAMPPGDDVPLVRFTSRTHGASQVVGYNKTAMVFFMLRDALGATAFDDGVRTFWQEQRFRVASWDDLRAAFEHASGKPLAPFFDEWVSRAGAPDLRIGDAQVTRMGSGWRLDVSLQQGTPAYTISVPLVVRTADADITHRVQISRDAQTITLDLPNEPLTITLDPELRIFRRLGAGEAPPILREAMLAASPAVSVLAKGSALEAAARDITSALLQRSTANSAAAIAVVIGLHAQVDDWLAGQKLPARPALLAPTQGTAQVWTMRADNGRTVVLISGRDASSLAAISSALPHYGQQSYLVFEGSRVSERGTWPSQPQVWEVKRSAGDRK